MIDPSTSSVMTAFFAAVTAVEEGKVAEVEIEHRQIRDDMSEEILTFTIRRSIRGLITMPDPAGDEDA